MAQLAALPGLPRVLLPPGLGLPVQRPLWLEALLLLRDSGGRFQEQIGGQLELLGLLDDGRVHVEDAGPVYWQLRSTSETAAAADGLGVLGVFIRLAALIDAPVVLCKVRMLTLEGLKFFLGNLSSAHVCER